MSVRTTVHLLRHGEVENPDRVLYGRLPDYHLSERGRQMALKVADHLEGNDVTVLVASPLERAQETAAPMAAVHGLSITSDERVIEAANHFEGHTFGSGLGSPMHPRNVRYLLNPFRPSWGEPYAEIAARVLAAVADARERARGHEAVIVSHQLPIWSTRSRLEGRRLWHDPRSRECSLASLTSLVYDDDHLVALTYSQPAASLLPGASEVPGA